MRSEPDSLECPRENLKKTVYETIFPPYDKKLLKDRVFWREVVNDLQELKEIMEPKMVSEPEDDDPFQIRPPKKWAND